MALKCCNYIHAMSTTFGQQTLVETVADESKNDLKSEPLTLTDGGGRAWSVLLGV